MEPSSYASEKKGKNGIKRIINAFGYSKDGLAAAYRYESAFRQVFWLNLILIVLALFLDFGPAIKMVLVAASFISLITELFNTAVEAAVDHTSTEKHELAKRAKDAGIKQFGKLGRRKSPRGNPRGHDCLPRKG